MIINHVKNHIFFFFVSSARALATVTAIIDGTGSIGNQSFIHYLFSYIVY